MFLAGNSSPKGPGFDVRTGIIRFIVRKELHYSTTVALIYRTKLNLVQSPCQIKHLIVQASGFNVRSSSLTSTRPYWIKRLLHMD